jgi:hypothetical protein
MLKYLQKGFYHLLYGFRMGRDSGSGRYSTFTQIVRRSRVYRTIRLVSGKNDFIKLGLRKIKGFFKR